MRKVGVISNGERDIGLESAKKTVLWLKEQGVCPVVNEQVGAKIGMREYAVEINELYSQTEFLIVLGGDGTMLRVAKNAALMDVPLLGINFGTLGYLTDVEAGQAFEAITKVLDGSYTVQKRMMLESQIDSDDINKGTCLSLNDVCVIHSSFSNMVTIDLYINDEFIDTYRSDGFIVATPTGSTAYNLSAGGSILKPDSEMIALTPICPHMLYARPLVIPANDVVKIILSHAHNYEGVVVLDGQSHNPFYPGNIVTIKRSEYYTSIIKTENNSFFDILRHKMMRTAK